MKNIYIVLFLIGSSVLSAQNKEGYQIIKLVETTPVKNQQFSNACWSYATTSFIETEILRMQNKEIILSPMFFVYYNYLNQAENYIRMHGQTRFSAGGLTFHVMKVLENYGCLPQDEFTGLPAGIEFLDCSPVFNSMYNKLRSVVKLNQINAWKAPIVADLEKYIGRLPKKIVYRGDSITAQTWYHGEYYNLPINEFMMVIDSALYNGYSLVWDGDISEYPLINNNQIDYSINVLDLPTELNQSHYINQKLRQKSFDNYTTTEDHLSHLVGIAKDKSGNKYYILKDSQGADKFLNGYIYLSDSYVQLKTISILAHREILEKVVKK
jgi:bleomycin hydrolase